MFRKIFKYENKQRAITQKLINKSYSSCALHSPLLRSIHPQNSITIASIVMEICSGQNSSMKTKAVTQKLSKQELRFMYIALPLDKIYHPSKFHNHSWYSLGDMLQTKNWTPPTCRLGTTGDPIICQCVH